MAVELFGKVGTLLETLKAWKIFLVLNSHVSALAERTQTLNHSVPLRTERTMHWRLPLVLVVQFSFRQVLDRPPGLVFMTILLPWLAK